MLTGKYVQDLPNTRKDVTQYCLSIRKPNLAGRKTGPKVR